MPCESIEGRPGDPSSAASGRFERENTMLRAGALVAEASLKRLKTDVIALFYQSASIHRAGRRRAGINEQEIGIYSL